MDDTDKVSSDRFNDLKETLNTRFNGVDNQLGTIQKTLDSFESKDHAAAEFSHLNFRLDELHSQIDDSKDDLESFRSQIYRTVTLITSIVSIVITLVTNFLPVLH